MDETEALRKIQANEFTASGMREVKMTLLLSSLIRIRTSAISLEHAKSIAKEAIDTYDEITIKEVANENPESG